VTDLERIEQRLAAVERTVVDGDHDLEELADVSALTDDVRELESTVEEFSSRLAEVEADLESLGGYVSNVDSVNEDVQQQAFAAMATVDRLEERLDGLDDRVAALDPERGDLEGEVADAVADVDDPGSGSPDGGGTARGDGTDADATTDDDARDGFGPFEPPSELSKGDDRGANDGSTGHAGAASGSRSAVESDGGTATTPASTADQQTVDRMFEDDASGTDAADDGDGDGVLEIIRSKLP